MSGVTGLGTTYNLPNYTGILHSLTPSATPLFSAIGGLTGGGQTSSTEFEWESFDLRTADQNTKVEGATAPTAENRVRGQIKNLVQIHQEKVSISYSKLAAYAEKAGVNNDAVNPVTNESDWQIEQMLKQMVRDVEFSFINGRYYLPATNADARKTRGLRQAVTTNVTNLGTAIGTGLTVTASTDKVTSAGHGVANGSRIYLRNITPGTPGAATGLRDTIVYYLVNTATNDFKLSLTSGGAAVDVLADCTADAYIIGASVPDTDVVGAFMQSIYDSGGIKEPDVFTFFAGSTQKRALTKAFANAYGKVVSDDRNVGGVNMTELETDFGKVNIVLSRDIPKHEITGVSLDMLRPVYREIPGKGHFFVEELGKTGASEDSQLYGEVGLEYGAELDHGVLTGLAI